MTASTRPLILDINPLTDDRAVIGLIAGLTSDEVAELATLAPMFQASATPRWFAGMLYEVRRNRDMIQLGCYDEQLGIELDRALSVLGAFRPSLNWHNVLLTHHNPWRGMVRD